MWTRKWSEATTWMWSSSNEGKTAGSGSGRYSVNADTTGRLQVGRYSSDGFGILPRTEPLERCYGNVIDDEVYVGAGEEPVDFDEIGPIRESAHYGRYAGHLSTLGELPVGEEP